MWHFPLEKELLLTLSWVRGLQLLHPKLLGSPALVLSDIWSIMN